MSPTLEPIELWTRAHTLRGALWACPVASSVKLKRRV